MAGAYQEVLDKISAEGLHPQVVSAQLAAFLSDETPTHSVVLSDMKMDPDSGVRMILTIGLLTPSRLLFVDVTEDADPSDEHVQVLRTAMRILPLRSVTEVRMMAFVPSPNGQQVPPRRFQVEFVTSEVGELQLEAEICGSLIVDGQHVDEDDLEAMDPDRAETADVCTDPLGFSGIVNSNGILLLEDAALSGVRPVEDLMAFAAAVSIGIARP